MEAIYNYLNLVTLLCFLLILIINPTMIAHNPNIPPATEAAIIASGAESVVVLCVAFTETPGVIIVAKLTQQVD